MLKITSRIGLPVTETSGIDCLQMCLNKEHFRNYPKKITYQYNSRGFRDVEWPDDLSDVMWCLGDSFTVGIGQPYEEIWPQVLESKLGRRCINVGEDGCSNDTMALRAQEICKLYRPKLIVVMWSYFHRRRVNDKNVRFEKTAFGLEADMYNFSKNFKIVDNLPTNVVHLLIPFAIIDINKYSNQQLEYILIQSKVLNDQQVKNILTFPQLDRARDYNHFDIKTSEYVCNLIEKKINNFDKQKII